MNGLANLLIFFLVPLTKQQETYIRDSSALINKLETIRHPTDCLIASFDIRQMYTNLEINEMVEAVGRAWDQLNSADYNIKVLNKNTIEILTRFILENNYFTFNNKYYRQVIGASMGSKCSPGVADIKAYEVIKGIVNSFETKEKLYSSDATDIIVL